MKLFVILLFSLFLAGCVFDENRKIEKAMEKSIVEFHQKMNNELYNEIFAEANDELKNKFSEQEFTAKLRAVHDKFDFLPNKAPFVSINDELADGIRRTAGFKRTKFTHVELISDDSQRKATEHFEWSVVNERAKLVSYEFKMLCETPCVLGIKTK